MSEGKKRRVLRIKNGEFLLAVHPNRVETTENITIALDVSTISFMELYDVTFNLQKAGYKEMKVLEVN